LSKEWEFSEKGIENHSFNHGQHPAHSL